eukprot:4709042-Pleurochrysis_carterae.AAC.8
MGGKSRCKLLPSLHKSNTIAQIRGSNHDFDSKLSTRLAVAREGAKQSHVLQACGMRSRGGAAGSGTSLAVVRTRQTRVEAHSPF